MKRRERRKLRLVLNSNFVPAMNRYSIIISLLLILPCLILTLIPSRALPSDSNVDYTVSIEGITDPRVRSLLENTLNTVLLKDRPPPSLSILKNRIREDIPLIMTVLRSQGFYGGRAEYELVENVKPVKVLFRVDPGPPYLLESMDIQIRGEALGLRDELLSREKVPLTIGSPAKSKGILDNLDSIRDWLTTRGFPFVSVERPKVIVDHARHAVSVTYILDSGVRARFGKTHIEGLRSVDESIVLQKLPWKEGKEFNSDLLTQARENLNNTFLFSSINIREGEGLDEKGGLPIYIRVIERKPRTLKAGLSYKSDEGPGAKISWEHRNIFGGGERLNTSGIISEIAYSAEGNLYKPDFFRNDQALILNLRMAEDTPDAYTSRNVTGLLKIERLLSKRNVLSAGIGLRRSNIEQFGREESFTLISMPVSFGRDTRDDVLDPLKGGNLNVQVAPHYGPFGSNLRFIKGEVGYSRYFHLSTSPFLVLAARSNIGMTEGASFDEISRQT